MSSFQHVCFRLRVLHFTSINTHTDKPRTAALDFQERTYPLLPFSVTVALTPDRYFIMRLRFDLILLTTVMLSGFIPIKTLPLHCRLFAAATPF